MLRVISLVHICLVGRPGVRAPEDEHLNIRLTFPSLTERQKLCTRDAFSMDTTWVSERGSETTMAPS